jgi:hypothetical protein
MRDPTHLHVIISYTQFRRRICSYFYRLINVSVYFLLLCRKLLDVVNEHAIQDSNFSVKFAICMSSNQWRLMDDDNVMQEIMINILQKNYTGKSFVRSDNRCAFFCSPFVVDSLEFIHIYLQLCRWFVNGRKFRAFLVWFRTGFGLLSLKGVSDFV